MTPFPLVVRAAFAGLPDEASHIATHPPSWAATFTPQDHQGALDPNRTIVIGDRGTGKSFWSSVLVDAAMRGRVARQYKRLELDRVRSALGYSSAAITDCHPAADEIGRIATDETRTDALWRAILLRNAPCSPKGMPAGQRGWHAATEWVMKDNALRNREFLELDEWLVSHRLTYLLVFDGLDLLASRWSDIRARVRGLLRLALAVRSLRAVRTKLFLRPDMIRDPEVWGVGDASKLRHNEVELRWRRRDLYGLLWTLLANAPEGGEEFRNHLTGDGGGPFALEDNSWRPTGAITEDEVKQEAIFHALAGPWMGGGPRRGNTFTWVPNHLADAALSAAPRSFLLAMRDAAHNARSDQLVLDRTGIEQGVRIASKVRVGELQEDYRWMPEVLSALQGLTIPLDRDSLIGRWQEREVLKKLHSLAKVRDSDQRFIPPGRVFDRPTEIAAYEELIALMIQLRICFELSDGRINMPDLFRLEAKIKRRGGMRPVA